MTNPRYLSPVALAYAAVLTLVEHTSLGIDERRELRDELVPLCTVQDVIQWGLSLPNEQLIAEVVVQDEFTHDVVIGWIGKLHLAFDTN